MKTIKQIITVVAVAIFMMGTFSVKAQTSYNNENEFSNTFEITSTTKTDLNIEIISEDALRVWWKTALADAAGALGGAGSVASISAGLALTNPLGWGWMAAGAVLGGAGASCARVAPDDSVIDIKILNPKVELAPQIGNDMDFVGSEHNSIIIGFANSGLTFNADNYVKYIRSLKNSKYDKVLDHVGVEYFNNEFSKVRKLNSSSEVLELINSRLPKSINKEKLISELEKALNASTNKGFIENIKKIELSYIHNKKIEFYDNIQLKSFFSTLRHSAELWIE